MTKEAIRIRGAQQNNLKNLDIDIPLGEMTVVTGVSGSGKSSLAFDTIYSEGQRRYVETFSAYARQFLDRMDKPAVERIDGIPPAIAIDQTNPVRTSRSTVGTMTELNDHIKLLYARAGQLFCHGCARPVARDSASTIAKQVLALFDPARPSRLVLTFTVSVPDNFSTEEIARFLAREGYTRIHSQSSESIEVIQDRIRLRANSRSRLVEGLDAALQRGQGEVSVYHLDDDGATLDHLRYSAALHCPDCDIRYRVPTPNLFSFNSPLGACETCRGFGRTIGIDYHLVVPDHSKSIAGGAIKPWQTKSYQNCQRDLMRHAKAKSIDVNAPWSALSEDTRNWVLEGEGRRREKKWYGAKRFFDWLESKSYRMHIRVLLSKYRAYHECPECVGARLRPEALNYRVGNEDDANRVLTAGFTRFSANSFGYPRKVLDALPGLGVHDLMTLPLERVSKFFANLHLPQPLDEASDLLLSEIRTRLKFLTDVGLGYLTLDRQSRTLSGGEVQRINLTTALGTSLVNALFVLDEPSIGLHARDMSRVIEILHRLRDAGNTLLVVEHDRQVMLDADRVIDMGPGPGQHGGQVVFYGTPAKLLTAKNSLTGSYLSGRRDVLEHKRAQNLPDRDTDWIHIDGASENNLRDVDVALPLNRLVCVSGVSGSGKSTLIEDVLYRGALRHFGKPSESPGTHRDLRGLDSIDDVALVDQSSIGKSTRSNPASYVGALSPIRKLFSELPAARERGYSAGTFSFNSGNGRCPTCSGSGFEHVEMQFLSDVYLRCPDCDGRRYRDEVLELKILPPGDSERLQDEVGCSIADVLDMTADAAVDFFAYSKEVHRVLEPLRAVGLGYMQLGQPVSSLSGGEAQRLKLAGHLAKAASKKNAQERTLFLFDEPTTGLHFDDISKLIGAFDRLVEAGHSLIVIEHNLDIIRAADWIVDLGPEGGEAGGVIQFSGDPNALPQSGSGATAQALLDDQASAGRATGKSDTRRTRGRHKVIDIEINNAREHNLKDVNVRIPGKGLTVITGVSGSGKSTVAFDILFAEGQRRYLESLNAYARQFVQPASRPDVDAVLGVPPTVAIEQRTSRGGKKSTVSTVTGIYHFVRLLFTKLGEQYCPDCDVLIAPQSIDTIIAHAMKRYRDQTVTVLSPLIVARKGYYTDLAKWAAGRGFAHLRVDGELLPTEPWPRLDRFHEHDIELPVGTVKVTPETELALRNLITNALGVGDGVVQLLANASQTARSKRPASPEIFSTKRACPSCARSFPEPDPRLLSFNSQHGWCKKCYGTGEILADFDSSQTGEEDSWLTPNSAEDAVPKPCPACHGARLRPEALAIRLRNQSIAEFSNQTVEAAQKRLTQWRFKGREAAIAQDVVAELAPRLRFLREVGLGYLSLNRPAPTLSGGEAQRIRLAAQLGSNLRGVCYILDEPTIGLHTRDNQLLLDTLQELESKGNTVVVVEHDEDTIRRADHIIDLGPGAGVTGGEVVAFGSLAKIQKSRRSVTGRFLANPLQHPIAERKAPTKNDPKLTIHGATLHNLRSVNVALPLGRLICVTGVSGSGKSSLIRGVLQKNLTEITAAKRTRNRKRRAQPYGCEAIAGHDIIDRVLEVDQTPIGKTPRSCPATYVGIWDYIRRLYADTSEARIRGYEPARFSFNVSGGRCDTCQGQGQQRIEMSFLPDVRVQCDDCGGQRFNQDTCEVLFRDRSIANVLNMSVGDAVEFFDAHHQIRHVLQLMCDIGLDYLTLGQPSPTLSGGEAQRIKLVTELAKAPLDDPDNELPSRRKRPHTLYILDEPTIGLHMADVEKLIKVLHRLVDAGNTVAVIEHNLDVAAEADWMIDMGPEGGSGGGKVVAQGTLAQLCRAKRSHTGQALNEFLKTRSP
ncbi:MAG: excinuclease ABC subunit UvrA [Gammaproteobacteria bacterium]|nr:excinuclease ABC subunit UvrA [Gammaproteobacteria bacterium]